jgi:hypothetical protein
LDTPEVAVARYAAQIALWALGVSGIAAVISLCGFFLQLRRWFDEGVKLSMTIMSDAKVFSQSWSRKSEQGDKWSFCLTAGTLCPANQEKP